MQRARKTSRLLTGLLLLVLGATAAVAQPFASAQEKPKRPMTFMDVMEMRSVGAGSISPDGRWVLYTVSIPQWKAGKNFTDIFLAPTGGPSPPRQMTFTKEKNETQPQWARDSRTFGFLSDRDAVGTAITNQLYLMRIDGVEARKLSDAKEGVNASAFSRDGKWLAYSTGKPEERQLWLVSLATDDATPVQLTKHATPVGPWAWSPDSARIFFIAPDSVDKDDLKRKAKKFDVRIVDQEKPPAHLWSIEITDKSEKRWTSGSAYSVRQFTISPNGRWLAFQTSSTDRYANPVTQEDSEIYILDLQRGGVRRVTDNHLLEGPPRFSPDSQWLAFSAPYHVWGPNRKLYVTPAAGGPLRKLLADWDYSSSRDATWSSDSKTLYFTGGIGVDQHIFGVSVPDGKVAQLTRERGVIGGGFDPETGFFLVTFSDPTQPADYYAVRPETLGQRARWVRLSDANPQVAGFQLGEYETIRWKSTDGQMVEGILVKPVGYQPGKRYPLVVQLRTGPALPDRNAFSGDYYSYAHIFAANGYAILKPNYRGAEGYGEKFHIQIAGDFFRQGYEDIMAGVDYLIARGIADPDKLGMMGWGIGGSFSNWTLTHTGRFKAISTGAGHANWISSYAQSDVQEPFEFYQERKPWENWDGYVAVSPLRYIQNAKTPTLIHVGEVDHYGMKPQCDELHMALKKLGVPVEYIVYPGMSHSLTDPRYQMVKMVSEFNWFEKWIKGKPGWFDWKTLLDTLEEPKR